MVNKKELKKALVIHDITPQIIADAAGVHVSTVYRWLADPEKLNIGQIELIKNITGMDAQEFTRVFYCP